MAIGLTCFAGAAQAQQWTEFRGQYPIKAVATTGILADLVKRVGGSQVAVKMLIKSDPHLYKPTAEALSDLTHADIVFANGLFLEVKIAEQLSKLGRKQRILALAERLDPELLLKSGQIERQYDPHVVFDVSLARRMVEIIRDAFSAIDPRNAELYHSRAATFSAQLSALHQYATTVLASIPRDHRVLITAHDGFRYFGRAYDLNARGIEGISTEPVPVLRDLKVLADVIVGKEIPAVFPEASVSRNHIETLAAAARAQGAEVVVDETVYSDTIGPEGSELSTYIGVVEHNVNTIAKALGGTVPANGFLTLEDIHARSR